MVKTLEFITETLGVCITRKVWEETRKLPYFLSDEYDFQAVTLDSSMCIFITPKEDLPIINTLKKHLTAIQKFTNMPIVVELDNITRQKRKSLIENKIPFVVTGKQIYLPFLGIALQEKFDNNASILHQEKLLPSAQMLLFAFIYGHCEPIYLSKIAKKFNITSMSVLRAANQLETLNLINITTDGRSKVINCNLSPRELFEKEKPHLISPIRKKVYINKTDIDCTMFKSGLSAISSYSMLNVPQLETFGTVAQIKNTDYSDTLIDTDKQCELEFWKYDTTTLSNTNDADVLSLTVCLEENHDERVHIELENLLNEKVWN